MGNMFLAAIKKCPQCGYRVEDPDTVRCPRCYKSLLKPACCQGNCSSCGRERKSVSGNCAEKIGALK